MRILSSTAAMIVGVLAVGSHCTLPGTGAPTESNRWIAGTATHTVDAGSGVREFLLHIPPSRPRNRLGVALAYPLIIALHGSGADGQTVQRQSGLDSVADANGWLIAYPNAVAGTFGLGSDWNAGSCCGIANRDSVDDARFIVSIIDRVSTQLPVNQRRVYVAGFSAGARMAYHVACSSSGRIAAIAVVAGSVRDAHCNPARPVPLIAFHGTDDDEVSYGEPSDTPPHKELLDGAIGLPPSIQMWAADNGCVGVRHTPAAPDVTRFVFTRCQGDVEVFTVTGGHHGWPGEPGGVGSTAPMSHIHATPIIARFFARHIR